MIAGGLGLRSRRRWWWIMEGTVRRQRETESQNTQSQNTQSQNTQSQNTQSQNTHNNKMMTMGMLVWSIRTSAPRM